MVAFGPPRQPDEGDLFNMGSFPASLPLYPTSSWLHVLRIRPAWTPSIPKN